MKKLAMFLAWLSDDCPDFHCYAHGENSIEIWHTKNLKHNFKESYFIDLNSKKSVNDACNIMQCLVNGVFGEYEDLKHGC